MDDIDRKVQRMLAHIDQHRCTMREALLELDANARAELVRTCAAGRLDELDEPLRLLVGNLAAAAIFDLCGAIDGKEGD
jgi:hypothetical protein